MVFTDSAPPSGDELEARMASWPVPSLVQNVEGTWLGDANKSYFSKMVDAYLYLGPADLMLAEPRPAEIFLNADYMTELRRRATIIGDERVTDQTNPARFSDRDFSPFLYPYAFRKLSQSPRDPSQSAVPSQKGLTRKS
jgi:hypothetical protein